MLQCIYPFLSSLLHARATSYKISRKSCHRSTCHVTHQKTKFLLSFIGKGERRRKKKGFTPSLRHRHKTLAPGLTSADFAWALNLACHGLKKSYSTTNQEDDSSKNNHQFLLLHQSGPYSSKWQWQCSIALRIVWALRDPCFSPVSCSTRTSVSPYINAISVAYLQEACLHTFCVQASEDEINMVLHALQIKP